MTRSDVDVALGSSNAESENGTVRRRDNQVRRTARSSQLVAEEIVGWNGEDEVGDSICMRIGRYLMSGGKYGTATGYISERRLWTLQRTHRSPSCLELSSPS
jgi:hypothetical protein